MRKGNISSVTIYNTKRKDYDKNALKVLISKELFSDRSNYICNQCLKYADEISNENEINETQSSHETQYSTSNDKTNQILLIIDSLINLLNSEEFNHILVAPKISLLASLIDNKFVSQSLISTANNIQNIYKSHNDLVNINTKTFLNKTDPILQSFLSGSIGYNINSTTNPEYLYKFSMVTETIYHLKNQNLILPHCFLVNLIQSFISGSKTAVTALNGKIMPSAGDATYRN